jgi:hypothetical protein
LCTSLQRTPRPGLSSHSCCIVVLHLLSFAHQGPACLAAHPHLPATTILYRRTDDVERLQKVIADTEQQFTDCLQRIKTLGEEEEQQQKELEDLK